MPSPIAHHWRATVLQRDFVATWSRGAWLAAIREELSAAGIPAGAAAEAVGVCTDEGNEGPSGFLLGPGYHATFHLWSEATPRVCELDLFTMNDTPPDILRTATGPLLSPGDVYTDYEVARGDPRESCVSSGRVLQRATPAHPYSSHLVMHYHFRAAANRSTTCFVRDATPRLIQSVMAAAVLQPFLPAAYALIQDDCFVYSALQAIKTSHISLHTFITESTAHIYFDLFSCKAFPRHEVEDLVSSFVRRVVCRSGP
jgi:hypothetical protein